MRIRLSTRVQRPFSEVADDFGQDLFEYLAPPKFLAEVDSYEGDRIGAEVIMDFKFPKGKWVSRIESHMRSEKRLRFVDRGVELPFPFKSWFHIHTISADGDETIIVDDMYFSARSILLSPFLYLAVGAGFLPRLWLYKRYFNDETNDHRSRVDRPTAGATAK